MGITVAYILCSANGTGGASKAFLNIIQGLLSYGVRPVVILPDNGPLNKKIIELGIKTYVVSFKPSTYPDYTTLSQIVLFLPRLLGRLYLNTKAISQIKRILSENNVNIVHTNTGINNVGRFAAQSLGIPHVFHIREYAYFVVASSFHGTVFALQFSKPFISISKNNSNNGRVANLLRQYDLLDRFVQKYDESQIETIMSEKLEIDLNIEERIESMDYLKTSIGNLN